MATRKFTSGVLATDADGTVAFFWGQSAPPKWSKHFETWRVAVQGDGRWTTACSASWGDWEWRDTYSLRPPKPVKCFECDVEL